MTTVLEETPKRKDANALGLILSDYKGGKTTLCKGCGHDAITSSIVKAFYDLSIDPVSL